jgi:lipopolysaccharide transport protein LptA
MFGFILWASVLGAAHAVLAEDVQAPAAPGDAAVVSVAKKKKSPEKNLSEAARESVITATRIEFDNKEGVILFDENVMVDDAQFQMRADRLLVFMEGTNDVQQLMAVGHVNITNESRSASCDKAVYTKKDGQIVMTGNARLIQGGGQAGEVTGTGLRSGWTTSGSRCCRAAWCSRPDLQQGRAQAFALSGM